jgi:uncharacterized membrane protein
MVRWIIHLDGYGSLRYTADLIETRAREALEDMARRPAQGARVLHTRRARPTGGVTIAARRAGYVEQVFEGALQDSAAYLDAEIFVLQPVGGFVQPGDVLARVIGGTPPGEEIAAAIRAAIPVGETRTFEMDPVYVVATLAEVATRALSPGVNDPNTAVDVTYRLARVMGALATEPQEGLRCDRVWMIPVERARLFEVGFGAVSRYAGGAIEVHLALQDALNSLTRLGDATLATEARAAASDHARRAFAMLEDEADRARFGAACLSPVSAP